MWQAVALIVSATIGAGILAVPYAIAKVGIAVGIVYLIGLGGLMIGMGLFLGEVAVRTRSNLQLVGLAKKYLGRGGEVLMTVLMYATILGVLTVYIIGSGEGLAVLFGGTSFFWSVMFVMSATLLIYIGLRTVKTVELVLTLLILFVVLFLASKGAPHVDILNFQYMHLAQLLFPYGVILFAYNSTTSIPEAHALLKENNGDFKKAIVISGLIAMAVYILFAIIVVGVTGAQTTEIATVGLGAALGRGVFFLGNIFAVLAMSTSFLIVGLSLRDSFEWDYKFPRSLATTLTCGIPFALFLFGLRQFIAVLDIVGGVLMSTEMLLIMLIYWRARQLGDAPPGRYKLHHTIFLFIALLIALSVGAVYSVLKLF